MGSGSGHARVRGIPVRHRRLGLGRSVFSQFGWETTRLSRAAADVIDTWQTVAGVQGGLLPDSLRVGSPISGQSRS